MNRRGFKGALFGSAAATVLLAAVSASPAAAQQVQPTPPPHYTPGPQGVDMVSGAYNHSVMEGSRSEIRTREA